MREVTTLLYGPKLESSDRSTSVVLSDNIENYDIIRIYCGYKDDGFTVNEIEVANRPWTGTINLWTFYQGSSSKTAMGSMRWNDFSYTSSTKTLTVKRTLLTYLNAGSTNYSNTSNTDWGPKPIYKVVGVKFVR